MQAEQAGEVDAGAEQRLAEDGNRLAGQKPTA